MSQVIPPPPKPPPCRIMRESGGPMEPCKDCGSSLVILHWWEWLIGGMFESWWVGDRGCIQPECENYHPKQ